MELSPPSNSPQGYLNMQKIEDIIGQTFKMAPRDIYSMTYRSSKESTSTSWTIPAAGAIRIERTEENAERCAEVLHSMDSFCASCEVVSRDMVLLYRNRGENPESVSTFVWTVVLDTLLEAVIKVCPFCTLMTRKFFARDELFVQSHREVENALACCGAASSEEIATEASENIERLRESTVAHPGATVGLVVEPVDYVVGEKGKRFAKVRFTPVETNLEVGLLNDLLSLHSPEDFSVTIEVFALSEEDGFFKYVRAGPINVRPGSDESISWARSQLKRCSSEHVDCPNEAMVPLPTRVVEILGDGDLRLATEQPDGLYATLSYCWGGAQRFQTTKDTLGAKSKKFNISVLPQTLQDAILLTQKLGLRYIWIDSLCIVQDDESDKLQELSNMERYYSTAHVTICAGGEDCNAGFLAPHSGCEHHPESELPRDLLRMPVLYTTDEGSAEITTLLFRPENTRVRRADAIEGRAWTLQERVLSARVLFYGYERSLWQCSSEIRGNGGNEDWKRLKPDGLFDNFDYQRIRAALLQGQAAVEGKEVVDLSKLQKLWYYTVEEYSCRALTNQGDKLPAITALASRFGVVFEDTPFAGLWGKDFLSQLLWSTFPRLGTVPSHSGAPSWSWASVTNRVTYARLPSNPYVCVTDQIDLSCRPTTSTERAITDPVELRIHAPVFTFGETGDSVIEQLLKQEYVLPSFSVSQLLFDMSNENLAHMELWSSSAPSNRNWTVPRGSALLFLAMEVKDGVESARNFAEGRFRADQVKLHGLVLAPVEEHETVSPEEGRDDEVEEKEKKWRRIGQFSELDGAEVPPFVQYAMQESAKEWVCIV